MTSNTATRAAIDFVTVNGSAILNNVNACGGRWLFSGMAQTARTAGLDLTDFTSATINLATLMGRNDLADKLNDIDWT